MEGESLLKLLEIWEKRELAAERAAVYARAQQARIIGQLAAEGVHLFPPVEYEE